MPKYDHYINAIFNRARMPKRETKVEKTTRDTHFLTELHGLGIVYHPATWENASYWTRQGVKVQAFPSPS